MCERELETEQNCNILTPTLWAITAFFFPVLQGCSTGGLGTQPLWVLVFSTTSYLRLVLISPNWLTSCLHPGYMILWRPLFFLRSVTISHSFNPSTIKVIISWYSSTGCTCYLHRCISYFWQPGQVGGQYTTVIRIQILDEAIMGKDLSRLGTVALVKQATNANENSQFYPAILC